MTRPAVTVPRGALFALVAALVVCVIAVAFLVGRESARSRGPASAPPATLAAASAPSQPPTTALASADTLPPALAASDVPPPAAAGPGIPLAASSPAAPQGPSAQDPLRDAVASYFREVEAIQSQGKAAGDPEAMARALLEQGSKGEMSGLDDLAAANRKVRDNLRAMTVPEPCREHHRLTLAVLDESLAMLERVKGQLGGEDESALAALPEAGRALEQKAKDVDALAAEIKRRFGL